MDTIQAVLFDLDGTVYAGDQLITGANTVIDYVRKQQKQVAFLTNNSTKTREQIQQKLIKLGVEAELSSIYTSASATVDYLIRNQIKSVYCLGTEAFKSELAAQGIATISDASVNCVVIGMTYEITEKDFTIIREISNKRESLIIACNLDLSYPDSSQSMATGCGHVVQQVEEYIQRQVDVVVGKPSKFMLEEFSKSSGISYENIMIVGDSYTSDIELALRYGCMPVLVDQAVLQHGDCIVINDVRLIKELFSLPVVFHNLYNVQNVDDLVTTILKPYQNTLDTLNNLRRTYIFGAQKLGEKMYEQCRLANIEVEAFIDNDVQKQGRTFKGKQIIPLDFCEKSDVIIIASTSLTDIQFQLSSRGYYNFIPYPLLTLFDEVNFKAEYTFENMHVDLIENKMRYLSLYLFLKEQKSKKILCDLISFRLDFEFRLTIEENRHSYFENDFLGLSKEEVFIDGGGYTGDTARAFIETVCGSYKEIHFFEPDEQLMDMAKSEMSQYSNISYYPKGLFSHETQLLFNQTGGLDGAISSKGNHTIEVTSIDLVIPKKVTFIKLDIEGAEEQALRGATGQLSMHRPKLAIACYHKAGDLWNLPRIVLEISPDYTLYFRHYSQSALETVLYCVPKE